MSGDIPNLPVWSIRPDWTGGVLERLEWLTDVMRSPSAAEQRRMLRITPRRTFEIGFHAHARIRTLVDLAVKAAGASDWLLPLWHGLIRTGEVLVSGASDRIHFATADHEYTVGGYAILYADEFNFELVVIAAINSAYLLLTAPVAAQWAAGTRLMPVIIAKFNQEPSTTRLTDLSITGTVAFTGSRSNPYPTDLGMSASYSGFPVLLTAPDMLDSLAEKYDRLTTLVDGETGVTSLFDSAGFGLKATPYRFTANGRAEQAALRKMLYGFAGRVRAFWLPSFAQDLTLVQDIAADDAAIVVQRCGYSTYTGQDVPGRQQIVIQQWGVDPVFATIVDSSLQELDDTETLTLSAPTGVAVEMTSVRRVSFMTLSRQDTDAIEIAHQTDDAGTSVVVTTFKEAPDLRNPGFDALDPGATTGGVLTNLDTTFNCVNNPDHNYTRGRHGKRAGKWYFEATYNWHLARFGFGQGVGISTAAASASGIESAAGIQACMLAFYGFGTQIFCNSITIYQNALDNLLGPFCIAVDLDNMRFYASPHKEGNNWNNGAGNPVAGTGGVDISGLVGDVFPCIAGGYSGDSWDINLGQTAFHRIVPSGYRPGWPPR